MKLARKIHWIKRYTQWFTASQALEHPWFEGVDDIHAV